MTQLKIFFCLLEISKMAINYQMSTKSWYPNFSLTVFLCGTGLLSASVKCLH